MCSFSQREANAAMIWIKEKNTTHITYHIGPTFVSSNACNYMNHAITTWQKQKEVNILIDFEFYMQQITDLVIG